MGATRISYSRTTECMGNMQSRSPCFDDQDQRHVPVNLWFKGKKALYDNLSKDDENVNQCSSRGTVRVMVEEYVSYSDREN